jgi:HSP20 family protein
MSTLTINREEKKELRPELMPFERGLLGGQVGFMRRFSEEMDRLFEDFGFRPRFFERPMDAALWSPDVEVLERDGQLIVRADLPGMAKDDVKVNLTDDLLTLEGERKQESETKRDGYFRSERSYGSFYRSIPLPEGIKTNAVQASFKNGVLEVTMPMAKSEKSVKPIEVKVA